jgi:hypothetical protein
MPFGWEHALLCFVRLSLGGSADASFLYGVSTVEINGMRLACMRVKCRRLCNRVTPLLCNLLESSTALRGTKLPVGGETLAAASSVVRGLPKRMGSCEEQDCQPIMQFSSFLTQGARPEAIQRGTLDSPDREMLREIVFAGQQAWVALLWPLGSRHTE